jgi:t-SNARE complex subunit (syntaxin)
LEADRKELIELDKLMEILKNMAKESENLLMGQGQQLRAAADKIGKAARNMGVAKGEMIEAREYTADSSRLTCYCFILVAAIVIIILLITYASYKK